MKIPLLNAEPLQSQVLQQCTGQAKQASSDSLNPPVVSDMVTDVSAIDDFIRPESCDSACKSHIYNNYKSISRLSDHSTYNHIRVMTHPVNTLKSRTYV